MFTLQAAARHCRPRSPWAALAIPAASGLLLAASVTFVSAAPQPANPASSPESVVVMVDHAKVVRLPEKAQTVIVGNPAIADVSLQKNGVMIVTGKSFGVTNLIALDSSGALLAESLVRVGAAADSVLTVQRGLERESYSCTPICQPAAQLGDVQRYFGEVGAQAASRNSQATGSAPGR